MERFIPLGQSRNLRDEVLDKSDWQEATKCVYDFLGIYSEDKDILPAKAFWIKFKQNPEELLSASCDLGSDSFAILPNGDLLPCRRFNLKLGNLCEENILDIIHKYDKLLKEVTNKNNLKGKCGTCLLNNCRGCRALGYALYNDYLAEDSQCWIEESESKGKRY